MKHMHFQNGDRRVRCRLVTELNLLQLQLRPASLEGFKAGSSLDHSAVQTATSKFKTPYTKHSVSCERLGCSMLSASCFKVWPSCTSSSSCAITIVATAQQRQQIMNSLPADMLAK